MTTGMPELGSKISLISKADIRYEGRLFTVDPQECTIALASVRSFGTEDREAQYPVPAQSQVYDYILFRGTDIKDIRVVNNVTQPLNDPAIMQLSVPPSLGAQNFQNHPVLSQFGSAYGNIAGAMNALSAAIGPGAPPLGMSGHDRTISAGACSTSKPSELINLGGPMPATSSSTVEPIGGVPINDHESVLDLIGCSRSTTPISFGSRKSPTNDQGVQAGGAKRDDKKVIKPIQPPNQQNPQRKYSRERRDSHPDSQNQHKTAPPKHGNRGMHQSGHQGYGQGNQASYHNQHNQGYRNQHNQGYRNNRSNNQTNWVNRGPMRARGRQRSSGYRNNRYQISSIDSFINPLAFPSDYDFEQANSQFEELRSQLGKIKLDEASSNSTKSETTTTGDVDKKDDSGNETGAGETEQEEEHEVYYDKSKSFFDKISCEAVERAKGKSQRTDWRVERKLNSETFGVAATRRGAYRGRGGYRGMGYRGGYRTNYNKQNQKREPQPATESQQDQGNRTSDSGELIVNEQPSLSISNSTESDSTTSTTTVEQSTLGDIIVVPEPAVAVK